MRTITQPGLSRGNDEELARAAQAGDGSAYGELISRHQRLVYRILWFRGAGSREDVEDLAQEAFVRGWEKLRSYDSRYPFRAWIAQIAVNLSIDSYRARARRPEIATDPDLLEPRTGDGGRYDPEGRLIESQQGELLLKHMMDLPEKYRDAVVLRFLEDLSYEEIAQVLSLPLGSVKTRIFRGRELLRRGLAEELGRGGAEGRG